LVLAEAAVAVAVAVVVVAAMAAHLLLRPLLLLHPQHRVPAASGMACPLHRLHQMCLRVLKPTTL